VKVLTIVSHQSLGRIITDADEWQLADIVSVSRAEIIAVFDFRTVPVAVRAGKREAAIEVVEGIQRSPQFESIEIIPGETEIGIELALARRRGAGGAVLHPKIAVQKKV